MNNSNFEEHAKTFLIEEFNEKLKYLRKRYAQVQKQFKKLCDELDHQSLNEQYIKDLAVHLTVYTAQIDLIEKKIKEISEIIENIKIDLIN